MTLDKQAAVIVPIYKNQLNNTEQISLNQTLRILGRHPLFFVMPESLECTLNLKYGEKVKFPDYYFKSVAAYNELLLSDFFYRRFELYDFILIVQLDVFVFRDELEHFCEQGYDYIGAPWLAGYSEYNILKRKVLHVGNGGFSLRRVSKCIEILNGRKDLLGTYRHRNEDIFFSACDGNGFQVAPMKAALEFAFEREVRKCYALNGRRLPFACHAWGRYDFAFWKPYIEGQGYQIEAMSFDAGQDDVKNIGQYQWLRKNSLLLESDDLFFNIGQRIGALLGDDYRGRLYLWGAGFWGDRVKKMFDDLSIPVAGYIDHSAEKQGRLMNRTAVYSPQELPPLSKIIVTTDRKYYASVEKELRERDKKHFQDYILWEDLLPEGTEESGEY